MSVSIPKIYFDQEDFALLRIVNDIMHREASYRTIKNLLRPYLHAHGIKELTAAKELRIAYAIAHLLGSLETENAIDRIHALRSLRDEVFSTSQGVLRKNTARVLIEIMKELVRSQGDHLRQLKLAHDFRRATSGQPRFVRHQLRKYHLIEMPEEWNQIAFDDHVHDANTKGRKSPTHLILDAWIKGIRRLNVVYYNYINAEVAAELLESAEIMGITVRIGIEFSARFRGRYIKLTWTPRGFTDKEDFLDFLARKSIRKFMEESKQVSIYQQKYVLEVFEAFNNKHRHSVNDIFDISLAPFRLEDFLKFIGAGQPSLLHLAKFIYNKLHTAVSEKLKDLSLTHTDETVDNKERVLAIITTFQKLNSDAIIDTYLDPAKNPDIYNPFIPHDTGAPGLLRLPPSSLLELLYELHLGCRITLNLRGLTVADVLEILYCCKGAITHLEIYSLKDYVIGTSICSNEINKLQLAINHGNVVVLKKMIRKTLDDLNASGVPEKELESRKEILTEILHNISTLKSFYKSSALKSRIGSDSTGRSRHHFGMGLVIKDTLPQRVQKQLENDSAHEHMNVPVFIPTQLRIIYHPSTLGEATLGILSYGRPKIASGFHDSSRKNKDWVVGEDIQLLQSGGNVAALGGIEVNIQNKPRTLLHTKENIGKSKTSNQYLNSHLKNGLKILIGFIPAFATFFFTKDWWLLAYFGAFIWFGITGLRNIIQSVLGGGGLRRSPLLKWDSYISWSRISDSLFYTGFSVPLLDLFIKTIVMDNLFGITTQTNPIALYSFMALANGVYISGHNLLRGLPEEAVYGNFFRSLLSIPLALFFNTLVGGLLGIAGIAEAQSILQKWAAVISKLASDCIAGVIEGIGDRLNNMRNREIDYVVKIKQMFDIYASLEILLPEENVLELLNNPKQLLKVIAVEKPELDNIMIINALDMLYFWMYQPRGANTLTKIMKSMTQEERQILIASLKVLQLQKRISKLFINGVLGKKFSKGLSFYLDQSPGYLKTVSSLA